MLDDGSLAAWLDDALPPAERSEVERQLLAEPEALRIAAEQRQIAAALRVFFGGSAAHERIKRAILADIHAEPLAGAKARLLHDTVEFHPAPRRRWWLVATAGALAAAACWLAVLWLRPPPSSPSMPVAVAPAPPAPVALVTPSPAPPRPLVANAAPVPAPSTPIPQSPSATPMVVVQSAQARVPSPTPMAVASLPRATPAKAAASPPPIVVAKLEKRDAGQWPFAAESPWNRPLGAAAKYEHLRFATRERADESRVGLRWRPIVFEEASGSAQRLSVAGGPAMELRLASLPAPGYDREQPWCVIDRERRFVTELAGVTQMGDGEISALAARRVDLRSSGFAPDGRGISEHGGSALGGILRHGEVATGVRHALAIALNRHSLNRHGPGGNAFVWPANGVEPNARKQFAERGNVFVGSLLAIPPAVKIETLGVGARGSFGYELAQAMQDYGVYVTGSCQWQSLHFFTAEADGPGNLEAILTRLFQELHVVTNNTLATPAGGGVPRGPRAPEFGP